MRIRDVRVFGAADWALFVPCAALNLAASTWVSLRLASVVDPLGRPFLLLALLPWVGGVLGFQVRWFSLPLMRRPRPVEPAPGQRVAVVTTFVPGLEPLDMLRRTVAAMVAIDHPHNTWVLDEGDEPAVRRVCDELGARHFSRRGVVRYQQRSGQFEARSKHGNYNAWLDAVGYEGYDVVVGFDPDHIPKPTFLARTLGYLRDERVGYVQAPQTYYNQPGGLVARGAAEETYGYYSSIQMSTYALGYPIVTGCHNVHRTTALRQVGGFAAHEADDLLITVLYRAAGWRGVYVPEPLAAGIAPADWRTYLTQQRRWARSVLDVKFRVFPRLAARLPLTERVVAALHGLYYLHGIGAALGVGTLAAATAAGWRVPVSVADVLGSTAVIGVALLVCELFRQRFYLEKGSERGLHLRAGLLKFAKWPYVLLATVDALRPRRQAYAITAKVRVDGGRPLTRAHGFAVATVAAGCLVGWWAGHPPSGSTLLLAVVYVGATVAVVVTEWRPAAAPYDDRLAAARVPWSAPGSVDDLVSR